jgi:hypothetical protein
VTVGEVSPADVREVGVAVAVADGGRLERDRRDGLDRITAGMGEEIHLRLGRRGDVDHVHRHLRREQDRPPERRAAVGAVRLRGTGHPAGPLGPPEKPARVRCLALAAEHHGVVSRGGLRPGEVLAVGVAEPARIEQPLAAGGEQRDAELVGVAMAAPVGAEVDKQAGRLATRSLAEHGHASPREQVARHGGRELVRRLLGTARPSRGRRPREPRIAIPFRGPGIGRRERPEVRRVAVVDRGKAAVRIRQP